MKRSALLVTSDGQRVLPETDAFFATLARIVPGSDPIGFAVRDLGFVKFHQGDDAVAIIEFDPRSVDRRALLRAERHIRDCGAAAFYIKTIGAAGSAGPPLPATEAVSRLSELRAPPDKPAAAGRFSSQPLDYASLLRKTDDPFCRLGRKWCSAFGAFDESIMAFVNENRMQSRFVVFGVTRRTEDVVFRFVDDLDSWMTLQCGVNPVGESLENVPDREYGSWVAQFYRAVARTGEPRCDIVSGTFSNATDTGYACRYERLLLPWKTASDETLVTTVSRVVWRSTDAAAAGN
jgi:hypothetical protein